LAAATYTELEGFGDIQGRVYDFDKAGDVLERHSHNEDTAHITIVACGKVKAYSHNLENNILSWKEAEAGEVLDFLSNEPHEITALEDNTRIFNIIKKFGGVSNDYEVTNV
jgi:quercetin dioxygenase-like cupin family protein